MSTLTMLLESACKGNCHFFLSVSANGGPKKLINMAAGDFDVPVTDQELVQAAKVLLRLNANAKTPALIQSDLTTGVVLTI